MKDSRLPWQILSDLTQRRPAASPGTFDLLALAADLMAERERERSCRVPKTQDEPPEPEPRKLCPCRVPGGFGSTGQVGGEMLKGVVLTLVSVL